MMIDFDDLLHRKKTRSVSLTCDILYWSQEVQAMYGRKISPFPGLRGRKKAQKYDVFGFQGVFSAKTLL